MDKNELRARMKRVLKGIDGRDRVARSAEAAHRLSETPAWKASDAVLCFLSMPDEIDTSGIIEQAKSAGKAVGVPLIEGRTIRFLLLPRDVGELPRDKWDIPVPDPSWPEIDLKSARGILVVSPGLAFDARGNRLGRGKGFYDGFLCETRQLYGDKLRVIGFCFAEQLVPFVPTESHDQPLDEVVSDRGFLECG